MPKWLIVILGILLTCVVIGGVAAWWIANNVDNFLSKPIEQEIARSVEDSVSQAISAQSGNSGEVRLTSADIDINSPGCPPDEVSFEVMNDDARICGGTTDLNNGRIEITLLDTVYSAVPDVKGSEIVMVDSTFDKSILGFAINREAFEEGIEAGMNNAFASAGLISTSAEIDSIILVITTE